MYLLLWIYHILGIFGGGFNLLVGESHKFRLTNDSTYTVILSNCEYENKIMCYLRLLVPPQEANEYVPYLMERTLKYIVCSNIRQYTGKIVTLRYKIHTGSILRTSILLFTLLCS